MKNIIEHTRVHIFRGLLAIIPIALCALAIFLLYKLIDEKVMVFVNKFIAIQQIPGMGLLLVLVCLYAIGLVVSNFLGHQFLKLLEFITTRIPLINTIYGMGKQLSMGLSAVDQDKQAFKKAVLVKLSDTGLMVPGFVMNSIKIAENGEEYLFVLVPTAPTPGSGFVTVVKASQTVDPGWTVEECLKAIVTVGIIAPPVTKKV